MCLILKQAITPLCAPRTLTFKLATILLTFKLATIPLFTLKLYVPKLKWLCPETRRRYSKEAHEQNTDNDV